MVGLCGVISPAGGGADVDSMAEDLRWTGGEAVAEHDTARASVRTVAHDADRAATATAGDALVSVWGDVWGAETDEGYLPRRESGEQTAAAFVAARYVADGIDCAAGLNGNFAAVVHDRAADAVHLVTDRLATHALYHARPDPDTVVFSSLVQSLPAHPAVETAFDVEMVGEYLAFGKVGGVKTPFEGIEELPPSSVTTVDLATGAIERERYWRPEYEPVDAPFSTFVDRFVDTLETVLAERLDPDTTYGLLLSGGSDSRAILGAAPDDVEIRAYHAADWQSRESRTAERVALADDREFTLLQRDRDTHARLLETVPATMSFQGQFNEAHLTGFGPRLRAETDVLVSGLGADTLFRDHAFPRPEVRLGRLGKFELPILTRTRSVDAFVDRRADSLPAFVRTPPTLRGTLERHVTADGDGFSHHGVGCRTLDELVFFDDVYPLSNKSDFFFHALNGIAPHWTPFFDNRLVDLALQLPLKYRVHRNLVDAAVVALDDRLATIPHANTGVPLDQPFAVTYLRHHANEFVRKHLSGDQPPKPYMSHEPWVNKTGYIREHPAVGAALRADADLVENLPFLDHDAVVRCHEAHLEGVDNSRALYTLITFLRMPAVRRLAGLETSAPPERPDAVASPE
jgi:asparagine synthase (glutamine-hydrolysing)